MERTYRVLLVDDEPIIIESLKIAIPWADWGMEIVGEARNGKEALDAARQLAPDLIVSDIRMPIVDGIAFMRETMKNHKGKEPIFIVVSGYGEFEYAREALRFGAFDYILKPIDHEELENIVRKAKLELDEYHIHRMRQEQLRHSLKRLSAIAQERLYTEMMDGQAPSPILEEGANLDMLETPFFLALVQLDRMQSVSGRWKAEEKRLWYFAADNILKELGSQKGCFTVFPYYSGEWVLLFPEMPLNEKRELGRDIVQAMQTNAKLTCSVGMSRAHTGFQQLRTCYRQAVHALYRQFIDGMQQVFVHEADNPGGAIAPAYPAAEEKRLTDAVKLLDEAGAKRALHNVYDHLIRSEATKETAKRILFEIAVIAQRQFALIPSVPNDVLYEAYIDLEQASTLQEMIRILEKSLSVWIGLAAASRSKEDGAAMIGKAKRYIETHYQQDIGIEEVAELAQMSCSYFCTLFKQATGCTFLEYVTRVRMDKACFILLHSEVKVFQVAPLVGYQDPRYFTQVFKKLVGMTPSEYREKHAGAKRSNGSETGPNRPGA
ncbi:MULTISPECIES: response regulator [unclassified Paenibacillus]|uniref:response regulator n=1 Tax=unclassified Paenibacillus TaxID=185978 RepID=UPI001C0F88DC|nr:MULTISPECIES: response regulator [unclassified Paenibacillus]MBU5443499.1 response regulator [Paenibacillus sp. MSJ-34]CAH0120593.1 Protein-glutamate methylesterase/protein-glutamine glutaminase [Paenibacillus sp. CECT 9249]